MISYCFFLLDFIMNAALLVGCGSKFFRCGLDADTKFANANLVVMVKLPSAKDSNRHPLESVQYRTDFTLPLYIGCSVPILWSITCRFRCFNLAESL